jgi:hypothetical protein
VAERDAFDGVRVLFAFALPVALLVARGLAVRDGVGAGVGQTRAVPDRLPTIRRASGSDFAPMPAFTEPAEKSGSAATVTSVVSTTLVSVTPGMSAWTPRKMATFPPEAET